MAVVAFQDAAGRPLSGAVVSIVAAPGEFHDLAMITDRLGEIRFTPTGFGDYEFGVYLAGSTRNVLVRIVDADTRLTVEMD